MLVFHIGLYIKKEYGEESMWAAVIGVFMYSYIKTSPVAFRRVSVHHGKLNLSQPFSASGGSRAAVIYNCGGDF